MLYHTKINFYFVQSFVHIFLPIIFFTKRIKIYLNKNISKLFEIKKPCMGYIVKCKKKKKDLIWFTGKFKILL